MNKRVLRLLTIFTLLVVTSSAVGLAAFSARQHLQSQQAQDASSGRLKTLREIAQERDVEITSEGESETEYADLRTLALHAEAIVLGRIIEMESSFNKSGEYVQTDHIVDVQRVLKDTQLNAPLLEGQAPPKPLTTPLRFVRSGGVVNVNGHRVAVRVRGQELLQVGKDYIFFFWWSPNYKAYYLAGGISGAVLVDDNRRVKPLASSSSIQSRYSSADVETFISEVLSGRQ